MRRFKLLLEKYNTRRFVLAELKNWIAGHWEVLFPIAFVVLVLSAGLYADWKFNLPKPPATSAITSYPLELKMEFAKTEYDQGELIEIEVFLKNISNRTVQLTVWGPIFDFDLSAANGTVVYQWSRNFFWVEPNVQVLKPSAELNYTQRSEIFDDATVNEVPIRLHKGAYNITEFTVLTIAYLEPWKSLGERVLRTPPITITIT